MKKLGNIAFVLFIMLAFSACKPTPQPSQVSQAGSADDLPKADITAITNREIASWEFAKTKQLDKLKEVLADDYQAFFGKILMNKTEVLQSFQKTNISAYRLSNIRVKKITDNVAIIYYEALQNAIDPDGDRWVPKIAASVTYVKRGGNWFSIFYHETPVMP
jgi:hypothetical protein